MAKKKDRIYDDEDDEDDEVKDDFEYDDEFFDQMNESMKDFMEHMTREPTEYVMDSTIQQSDMFAPPPAQGYVAVSSDQPISQQIEPVQVPPVSATMAFPQNM